MVHVTRSACLLCLALLTACTSSLTKGAHAPVRFASVPPVHEGNPYPNWPIPPAQAVALMSMEQPESRAVKGAGGGTTGAERHTLYYASADVEFDAKWKTVPGDLDGFNNAPRKEVAAYAIQPIFLDPEDYVVPASAILCVPVTDYRARHPLATATVKGTDCVLGVLSIWMENVTVPEVLYDEERFLTNPQYAYFMSNLNLFTYLVDHRDGRDGNFLTSKDENRRQVFAVDNGISFGPLVFNYFVPNWTHLRVAALRKDSIDRLRKVTRPDLDYLKVVVQLEADENGMLHTVPPGDPIDPDGGAHARDGVVQFGLKTSEIDGVFARITKLLNAVDAGQIPVF